MDFMSFGKCVFVLVGLDREWCAAEDIQQDGLTEQGIIGSIRVCDAAGDDPVGSFRSVPCFCRGGR